MKGQGVKKRIKSPGGQYSLAFKKRVVQEYTRGGLTRKKTEAGTLEK